MARGYTITVRATDAHGNTFDKDFDIEVADVDETPPDDPLPDGDDEPDDSGNYDVPPYSVTVDGAVKLAGKKKANGSTAKFIYNIYDEAPLEANTVYTMRYDPDFSLMSQGGELAMVGFMFKAGNDFYLVGLRGDGSTGIHAYEVRGDNLWNQTSGFTVDDGGAAAHGTQAGPNWIQLETSGDGTKMTFRTSSDGSSWTDEYTDRAITPFDDVTDVTAWGPGAFFHGDDDGPYSISVDLWTSAEPTDPHFASVVLLLGFNGDDGATATTDESPSGHTMTFGGNAQLDTAQSKFGGSSLLCDGTGDYVEAADHANWTMTGQFTIECWFRIAATSAGFYALMTQWGNSGTRAWWFGLQPGAVSQSVAVDVSTDGAAASHDLDSADLNYTTGVWYHLALDRDGSDKLRLYFNGTMVASKTGASGMFSSAAAMRVGLQANGTSGFNGWIDEVRITKGVARYASDAGFTPSTVAFPRS